MDITFVKGAQDNEDGHQGGQNQKRLTGQGVLECPGVACECRRQSRRQTQRALFGGNRLGRLAEREAVGEIEGEGYGREDSIVIDSQRRRGAYQGAERAQRHRLPGRRRNIQQFQGILVELEAPVDFENHPVHRNLGVVARDLPLAESVIQRIVEALHGHSEPRHSVAVQGNANLRWSRLQVGLHIPELGQCAQGRQDPRRPVL